MPLRSVPFGGWDAALLAVSRWRFSRTRGRDDLHIVGLADTRSVLGCWGCGVLPGKSSGHDLADCGFGLDVDSAAPSEVPSSSALRFEAHARQTKAAEPGTTTQPGTVFSCCGPSLFRSLCTVLASCAAAPGADRDDCFCGPASFAVGGGSPGVFCFSTTALRRMVDTACSFGCFDLAARLGLV